MFAKTVMGVTRLVTPNTVIDLVVAALSSVALATSRPAFQRWKSAVRQRAHMLADQELEPFLQSRKMKAFQWAWFAVIGFLLLIAVWGLLTQS
jgi:hypothetical protein